MRVAEFTGVDVVTGLVAILVGVVVSAGGVAVLVVVAHRGDGE
jgi:hypothetical protein